MSDLVTGQMREQKPLMREEDLVHLFCQMARYCKSGTYMTKKPREGHPDPTITSHYTAKVFMYYGLTEEEPQPGLGQLAPDPEMVVVEINEFQGMYTISLKGEITPEQRGHWNALTKKWVESYIGACHPDLPENMRRLMLEGNWLGVCDW